ncbi:MAG: alpha/beta fold hydrolase [Spirochaetales bacterium]|nr:alpha/beta fold hydrolase [Spirochaetales bacterium]
MEGESLAESRAIRQRHESEVLPHYARGEQGTLPGAGGVSLSYVGFPAQSPAGALVLLPGKGEPCLKYAELFYDLRGWGWSLYGLDHRGMGHSDRLLPDRRKVHVERFEDYVEDLAAFLRRVVQVRRPRRVVLLGHSTGAVVAARLLQERPGLADGAILSSPAFAPRLGPLPGGLIRFLAKTLDRPGRGEEYAPGEERARRRSFEENVISHSRARWGLWEEAIPAEHPEIVLGGVTRRWLRELTQAGGRALAAAGEVRAPVLLLAAAEDRVVLRRPQARFCRRCPTCTRVRLEGARHEVLIEADPVRERVIEEIRRFLDSRPAARG